MAKKPIECDDCGDPCVRRTRCKSCDQLVCGWCYHHVHGRSHAVPPRAPPKLKALPGGKGDG